jgi:hypothetical protein
MIPEHTTHDAPEEVDDRRLQQGDLPVRPADEDLHEEPDEDATIFPSSFDETGATVIGTGPDIAPVPEDPVSGSVIAEDWGRVPGNEMGTEEDAETTGR